MDFQVSLKTGYLPVINKGINHIQFKGDVETVNKITNLTVFSKTYYLPNSLLYIELSSFPQIFVLITTITKFIYKLY